MAERTTSAENAKKGHKDSIAKFKGPSSFGRRVLFPAILCSLVAISPFMSKGAFAQAPEEPDKTEDARPAAMPTPAIEYFDSLNSGGGFHFSPAFREVIANTCRLASENKSNEIFTLSLEMLLEAAIRRSSEGTFDSLGATGGKFAIGDAGSSERGVQLTPFGDSGAQFRIVVDGDTAAFRITPESSYDDVAELQKRMYSFFNIILNMHGLFTKVRPQPPQQQSPSTADLQEPMG
jgi:hypothetical protein